MKLVRLIKISLTDTYGKGYIDKHLSDALPLQNCLKQGDALSPLLFTFASEYAIRKVQDGGANGMEWNTSASGLY
jgi:predicted patatin/cPLA2 family phospholipase